MIRRFTSANFPVLCDWLAGRDHDLKAVISLHGYPPMWNRPNTFETLVHIILEQQVSLASARSALRQLKARIPEVTPEQLLKLTDEELRACYFSRQKIGYARGLALAMQDGSLDLSALEQLPDAAVREKLIALKGFGHWTVDVYSILVLHRADVFPGGDLAALASLKRIKHLPADTTKEEAVRIAAAWQPYRSIATMLLWHAYLSSPLANPTVDR